MIRVRVRLFASLSEAAQVPECWLVLPPGSSGGAAKFALLERYPTLGAWLDAVRLAVNWEYQPWDASLQDGDEIGFIPPVSGG